MSAAAEMWAEKALWMKKAKKSKPGFDGILPDGRKLQVKSKKVIARRDCDTYVTLSKETLKQADDLLIVFVDYDTCEVTRRIGPVPISGLKLINRNNRRSNRYYVSRILKIKPPPPDERL